MYSWWDTWFDLEYLSVSVKRGKRDQEEFRSQQDKWTVFRSCPIAKNGRSKRERRKQEPAWKINPNKQLGRVQTKNRSLRQRV